MARKPARTPTRQYVTRHEFEAILRTVDDRTMLIETLQKTCDIQFRRIAQIQQELDEIRSAWMKVQQSKRPRP
jgi:hypothetical protein